MMDFKNIMQHGLVVVVYILVENQVLLLEIN